MATRKEVGARRLALREEIQNAAHLRSLRPGMAIPPIRELAVRHSLSKQVAHEEVQRMVKEGLLYSLPGAGIFLGAPPTQVQTFFLIVDVDGKAAQQPIPLGFAQRISMLGGATLTLTIEEARRRGDAGKLPPLAGVWDSTEGIAFGLPWGPDRREIARAGSLMHLEDPLFMDGVAVDDFDGGRQAASHLLRLGHRRIAYLGVHSPRRAVPQHISWSAMREDGWRSALTEAGLSAAGLAFHPEDAAAAPETDCGDWSVETAAESAALSLEERPEITAVIAANDDAALTVARTLRRIGIPMARWPALVGFDNLPGGQGQLLSSLHLPLEQVGAAAADILWARHRGLLEDESPVRRLIPMALLPRITSERGWPLRMADAVALLLETNA